MFGDVEDYVQKKKRETCFIRIFEDVTKANWRGDVSFFLYCFIFFFCCCPQANRSTVLATGDDANPAGSLRAAGKMEICEGECTGNGDN